MWVVIVVFDVCVVIRRNVVIMCCVFVKGYKGCMVEGCFWCGLIGGGRGC